MTAWTAVGSNPACAWHNVNTSALTTQHVGDLIVLIVTNHSTSVLPTGATSSRVTWTTAVPAQGPTANAAVSTAPAQWAGMVLFGTVNSVGSDTVTLTWSGTTPAFINAVGMEFTSPTGTWSLDTWGSLNSAAGTSNSVSLTPASSAELYMTFDWNQGSSVSGTTTGYTYNANSDAASNGMAYNPNCASGSATFPVWGDSTETYGLAVLVSQSAPGFTPVGTTANSGSPNPTVTPSATGNFIALSVAAWNGSGAVHATAITGGGCNWTQLGTAFSNTVHGTPIAAGFTFWLGTATTTTGSALSITWDGSPTGGDLFWQEFHSPTGNAYLDVAGTLDQASGTTMPSLNPFTVAELYVGYEMGSSTAGSTSGYTYTVNTGGSGSSFCYNANCSSSAQAPGTGSSFGAAFAVLLSPNPTAAYTGTDGKLASQAIPGLAQPGAFIPGQVEPSIVTRSATLAAAATAHASFGGTRTAFKAFSASVTAHETVTGIRTTFGSLSSAVTAHMAATGTRTKFGSLTAVATAHMTAAGSRTTFGSLTSTATAHMTAAGTKTTFGSLSPAATAHAAFTPARTTFGNLTAAATAVMAATGTRTKSGSLAAAVTAHAAFTPTRTTFGSLSAAATAHAAFTSTRTTFGHFTPVVTASAAFARTRTTFGSLSAVATAHAAFTSTRTASGSFAPSVTAHMTAVSFRTVFGHFTPAVTAQAAIAPTSGKTGSLAAAVTAHAAFTSARITFGSLSATATAHAAFTATHTGFGQLSAVVTAHAAFTRTRTTFGSLSAAVTAHAVFTSTRTTFGSLTATATANAAFTRTRTTFGGLTTTATAHAVFTGTRTRFGQLSTAVTAHMTAAGTRTARGSLIATATANARFQAFKSTFGSFVAAITARLTALAVASLAHQPRNLGGTVIQAVLDSGSDTLVPNPYGGTATQANMGGGNVVLTLGGAANTIANVLGGSISDPGLGGTLTSIPFGGGVTGWTMQNVNLNFAEFNDITLNVTITSNGSALNLTGYTVNMLLKPLAGVLDSDGRVLTLSSAGGSPAITITNAGTGACTVAIPHSDLQDETHTFYRIDAVDGSGNINTAIYGNITYTSL